MYMYVVFIIYKLNSDILSCDFWVIHYICTWAYMELYMYLEALIKTFLVFTGNIYLYDAITIPQF